MVIIVNNSKIKVINEEDKLKISRLLDKSGNFNIKMLYNVIQLHINISVIIYIICWLYKKYIHCDMFFKSLIALLCTDFIVSFNSNYYFGQKR